MDFLSDPILFLANWLTGLMQGWGWADSFINVVVTFLGVFLVANFGMLYVIFLIWLERKLAARIQDRLGPNRAGPYGLFQTIADILKLFTKEDTTPAGADKLIFNIAPVLSVFSVLLIWAVVPFAQQWIGTDLNVAVLYIVAVGSIGIVATLIAGWSSNNKFAMLGAFRTVAQLVSYEVPMVLSLLVPVLLARNMGLNAIVEAQSNWISIFFWMAPIAALIFFISSIAEVGRTPFDLLEAESEIVAGFHIEYSGAKFAMIFAAEFLHAFTISVLTITLFFGGWQGWGDANPIVGWVWFMIKSMTAYFAVVWIRSTLPRIRIDHMLNYNWKFLTPISLAVLIVTAVLDRVIFDVFDPGAVTFAYVRSGILFAANLIIAWITVALLRRQWSQRPARVPVGQPRPVARPPEVSAEAQSTVS
ncbi:MAG TPA: NADH-quinone oxidoreductase subunit NuoH [Anaerolineales bacterium]|nr:NADH-quinone oxidoreductase subunit NuoH [Anaerolineales bacterium]